MQITEITPDMVFIMETSETLPERQYEKLLEEWKKVFPDNPLVFLKKDAVHILKKTK